jgi:hypothetical protein
MEGAVQEGAGCRAGKGVLSTVSGGKRWRRWCKTVLPRACTAEATSQPTLRSTQRTFCLFICAHKQALVLFQQLLNHT